MVACSCIVWLPQLSRAYKLFFFTLARESREIYEIRGPKIY